MKDLKTLIAELDKENAIAVVKERAEAGEDALVLLNECKAGMVEVGDKFQTGEAFLAELILSGDVFKEALNALMPYLAKTSDGESKGRVLLATLKGDIHYLGKGIVATMLKAYGFEVEDMGEDIDPAKFVERMKEFKPQFVGFSSLLTPNMQEMKKAVDLMKEAGLRDDVKVLIGGGITNDTCRDFVGADFQTIEAMEGVEYCLKVVGGN